MRTALMWKQSMMRGEGQPRSKNPPARRKRYSSRKEAYEAAKRAGKGKEPRHDPNDPKQDPHYHPNVETHRERLLKNHAVMIIIIILSD